MDLPRSPAPTPVHPVPRYPPPPPAVVRTAELHRAIRTMVAGDAVLTPRPVRPGKSSSAGRRGACPPASGSAIAWHRVGL